MILLTDLNLSPMKMIKWNVS